MKKYKKPLLFWGFRVLICCLLAFLFIRVRAVYLYRKKDYIHFKSSPKIYIANHLAYLDSLLIFIISRTVLYPIGKVEITKIPFVGYIYKHCVITVRRDSLISKRDTFEAMNRYVKDGGSVFIFPEGGFSDRPSKRLYPFNIGAFRLSLRNNIPIFPLLFLYTKERFDLYKKIRITPGIVKIVHFPPVLSDMKDEEQAVNLQHQLFVRMDTYLKTENYPKIV